MRQYHSGNDLVSRIQGDTAIAHHERHQIDHVACIHAARMHSPVAWQIQWAADEYVTIFILLTWAGELAIPSRRRCHIDNDCVR